MANQQGAAANDWTIRTDTDAANRKLLVLEHYIGAAGRADDTINVVISDDLYQKLTEALQSDTGGVTGSSPSYIFNG